MADQFIHAELTKINNQLGELTGQTKAILDRLNDGRTTIADHEKRIGALERWRMWIAGIWAGIGALLGAGASGHLPKL